MNTKISLNINVFAVYVGLVAAGYDMTNTSDNEKLINGIRRMSWDNQVIDYYSWAKTSTCEVNPYWPRAFLLTLASLYISEENNLIYKDFDAVMEHINSLNQIKLRDEEKEVYQWIKKLPSIHELVRETPGFHKLWQDYCEKIRDNESEYNEIIHNATTLVTEAFDLSIKELPPIVVIPNTLQAPEVADFVTINNVVYVVQYKPNVVAIVHEYLHQVLENKLELNANIIREYTFLLDPVFNKMLKHQYAWAKDEVSWLNVFEEHFIRAASIWIENKNNEKIAIEKAEKNADHGFIYVPIILNVFMSSWRGSHEIEMFIKECLEECKSKMHALKVINGK